MALSREQQRIAGEIIQQARSRYAPGAQRRKAINAALQTGLVESGLRNLDYGDADSQGWRQERTSIYGTGAKGPTNVKASVNRFFNEFDQFADPGERSYEIAAQVQRPAEQYRGRYRDVRAQANAIRRGFAGTGGGGGGATVPRASDPQAPGASVVGKSGFPLDPSRASGLAQLLGLLDEESAAPVQSTPLPGPAVTGRDALALPEGYQAVESGAPARPEQDKLEQALSLVESLGADLPGVTGPNVVGGGGRSGKRRGSAGGGTGGTGGTSMGGSAKGIGSAIEAIAREAGWPVGSGQRSASENAAVGGASDSDHLAAAGRYARDFPISGQENIEAAGRQLARQLGIKYQGGDTNAVIKVGGKRFRVQIITRPHGTGPHLHVGVRRA